MRLTLQSLVAGLLLVGVFYSCSVKKRHYRRGYHVSWHRAANEPPARPAVHPASDRSPSAVPPETVVVQVTPREDLPAGAATTAPGPAARAQMDAAALPSPASADQAAEDYVRGNASSLPAPPEAGPRMHPLALVSFCMAVFSIVIFATPIGLVGVLTAIASVVISSIALRDINRDPTAYSGRGFALAGLIISIVLLTILLFAIVILISLIGAII